MRPLKAERKIKCFNYVFQIYPIQQLKTAQRAKCSRGISQMDLQNSMALCHESLLQSPYSTKIYEQISGFGEIFVRYG
jgi:hypothetical protein